MAAGMAVMLAIKYPGQKKSLAKWIIGHFPQGYQEMTYLEPFFGSGSVFFNKEPSRSETVNDKCREFFNLFTQIREHGEALISLLAQTPWSRDDYLLAFEETLEPLEQARRFLVRSWFSAGSCAGSRKNMRMNAAGDNGGMDCFYRKLPEAVRETGKRLKYGKGHFIRIENRDALQLMGRYNREDVFMYLDPPQVPAVRKRKLSLIPEMSAFEHSLMLSFLEETKAKVLLSGYDHELYRENLKGWKADRRFTADENGRRYMKYVWANYDFPGGNGFCYGGGNAG
jgi:DNA adenine methylase